MNSEIVNGEIVNGGGTPPPLDLDAALFEMTRQKCSLTNALIQLLEADCALDTAAAGCGGGMRIAQLWEYPAWIEARQHARQAIFDSLPGPGPDPSPGGARRVRLSSSLSGRFASSAAPQDKSESEEASNE